jgi:hypothetical protein
VGLVVVWVGIPILLVVAGAWWLFGAFERVQARYLLRADVPGAPREWEKVEGIWAKLRAHFGSGATWKDLVYLLAKLPFGIVSTTLLVTAAAMVFWFVAMPFFSVFDVPIINGTWVPPLWFGLICLPLGILVFFVALHVLNAWSWVCARWAEVMFRGPAAPAVAPAAPALAGSVAPVPAQAPVPQAAAAAPVAPSPAPAPAAPEAALAAPDTATPADVPSDDETTS